MGVVSRRLAYGVPSQLRSARRWNGVAVMHCGEMEWICLALTIFATPLRVSEWTEAEVSRERGMCELEDLSS